MRRFGVIVVVLCLGVFACAQIADGVTSTTNINIGDTRIIHCRNQGVSVVAKNNVTDGQVSCVAPTTTTTTPPSTTTTTSIPPSTTTVPPTTTTTLAPSSSWPGPSNTGIPPGTVLTTVNGDLHITTAGSTVSAKNVTGKIYVDAANVTVKNSHATLGISAVLGNSQRTTIQDSDFGASSGRTCDCEGATLIATDFLRNNVHNFPDGIRSQGYNLIQDNWIHAFSVVSGDHNDGIQRYFPGVQGGQEILRHNTIECTGCTTSAIFYADDWRGTLIVDGNRLSGGGYTLRVHESGSVAVTNNVIGPWGIWADNFYLSQITAWSNNTTNTGAVLPPKCASGTTVPCAGG